MVACLGKLLGRARDRLSHSTAPPPPLTPKRARPWEEGPPYRVAYSLLALLFLVTKRGYTVPPPPPRAAIRGNKGSRARLPQPVRLYDGRECGFPAIAARLCVRSEHGGGCSPPAPALCLFLFFLAGRGSMEAPLLKEDSRAAPDRLPSPPLIEPALGRTRGVRYGRDGGRPSSTNPDPSGLSSRALSSSHDRSTPDGSRPASAVGLGPLILFLAAAAPVAALPIFT